jgi:hypothetical protein
LVYEKTYTAFPDLKYISHERVRFYRTGNSEESRRICAALWGDAFQQTHYLASAKSLRSSEAALVRFTEMDPKTTTFTKPWTWHISSRYKQIYVEKNKFYFSGHNLKIFKFYYLEINALGRKSRAFLDDDIG